MDTDNVVTLGSLVFDLPEPIERLGADALRAATDVAQAGVRRMHALIEEGRLGRRTALVGRVRGTGPAVSFGLLMRAIEVTFPMALRSPFEGSHNVSGAVLPLGKLLQEDRTDGFLRLRFRVETKDLPMHIHEHSDRLIFVLGGRGFFHVSPEPLETFTEVNVRHIPVRSRDVLVFPRGTIHTFSTATQPLELLSYHSPYIPLDDPCQYTATTPSVFPAVTADGAASRIRCDPAFSVVV